MNYKDLFSVQDNNIIVTGGTRGIGKGIARELVSYGANVTVLAQNTNNLIRLEEEIPKITTYACDLKSQQEIIEFCEYYIENTGKCDILINNAGIDRTGKVDMINNEDFFDVFKINLFAPFLLIKHILPSMKKNRSGVILNIASALGTRAAPGVAAYSSSKAALIHFTRCLSIEVAPYNIRANCISPGFCKTNMNQHFFESKAGMNFIKGKIPMQRLLDIEEIMPVVMLAISKAGSYMTGSNIVVDGGLNNW